MAQVLPLPVFILLMLLLPSLSISNPTGIRMDLTHVDSKLNLTKPELIQRAMQRTKHRIASLTSTTSTDFQIPVRFSGSASYQTDFSIGTPSLPLTWFVDTGSDLIWTQCEPCINCFPQNITIYNPSNSTTFVKVACDTPLCQALPTVTCAPDCDYTYSYADNTTTGGVLATETLAFGSDNPIIVQGIGFGCSDNTTNGNADGAAGLVGLGRGNLSLISQLGSGKFSYCLTSFGESNTSPLLFGSLAILNGTSQSTPLIQNPYLPTFYYLSLQGITVGSTLLSINSTVFELNSNGSGGLIIDSGTTYTGLEKIGYEALQQEFQAQVSLTVADGSRVGFDLCFSLPADTSNVTVPKLVFHFDGADMDLPVGNYIIQDSGLMCLAITPSSGMSILGNYQQQNMHILYDLNGGELSFLQTQCDQL